MTLAPDENELRLRAELRARIDGVPPPVPPSRPRDWLDDYLDATTPPPPPPPAVRPGTASGTPDESHEPRWDWRRLRHWPHLGITTALAMAFAPILNGYSLATGWGHILNQMRADAGPGGSWTAAGLWFTGAVVIARRRHTWPTKVAVTVTLFGLAAQASPFDLVTLITGVTR